VSVPEKLSREERKLWKRLQALESGADHAEQ